MARKVGSRELKTRLGTYLRWVRAGTTFVVTDRGMEVAELRPLYGKSRSPRAILEEMAARGEITLPRRKRMDPLRPVRLPKGVSASRTILEGREDGE